MHLSVREKQEQTKTQTRTRKETIKIRTEINEVEPTRTKNQ
jgi:hypothetical protein